MKFIDFDRLQRKFEDIQQELVGLPLSAPDCRIGDFGCGSGYVTLSLMLHLHAKECIGVDKDNSWDLPTVEETRQQFNARESVPKVGISEQARKMLDEGHFPTFQQIDVLDVERLPKKLDLAYCRRLLANLGRNDFNHGVQNIVDCIKQDGLFCFVEEINFRRDLTHLDFPNLKFLRVCEVVLRDMTIYVHLYRKR